MAKKRKKAARGKKSRAPDAVIADRLARFRAEMRKAKIPAYYINNRADQIYLTGFTGEDGGALITPRQVFLLTDGRFDESADIEAPWARKVLRKKTVVDELGKTVRRLKLDRLAAQAEYLTLALSQEIRKAIGSTRLVGGRPITREMRICKDAAELETTRKAIRIAELAIKKAIRQIRIGMTERELAARLEYEMKACGASEPSFATIVAEGSNASLPHAFPGDRPIRDGSAVLIDWGARVDFYCSDLTRVIFINKIPPKIRRIYNVVLEAQVRAIEAIRPGARLCDIDAVARKHIQKAGFGKQFMHSLGHGIGMDIHEAPRLGAQQTDRLQAGAIVTVEPGIYLRGVGGVRIEDDVLVTDDGFEVLSCLPKQIDQMVVQLDA